MRTCSQPRAELRDTLWMAYRRVLTVIHVRAIHEITLKCAMRDADCGEKPRLKGVGCEVES